MTGNMNSVDGTYCRGGLSGIDNTAAPKTKPPPAAMLRATDLVRGLL
jgi:hypothetical protein